MEKPWSGRFKERTDRLVESFTESLSFDRRLYRHDIEGSIAHARMLAKVGLISDEEMRRIVEGLEEIKGEIEEGTFPFSTSFEDIHMNIERRLVEKIGEAGEKLHTGRSRNDQIALDLRLYLRDEIGRILSLLRELEKALLHQAEQNMDAILPGYTHLQRAQPVSLAHHLLAYMDMFRRDEERYRDCLKRVNRMPLGSGALAGSTLPLDRRYVAELLNFPEIVENSMDAVSDRDFCIEFVSTSSILMMHLSRLGEELILWSTEEFGFLELPDAFTTGSSMMPQKKNPDVAELIRGKAGRIYGNLLCLLTIMKALPLTYNRDMQEDKPPLFDTVDTITACLSILPPMLHRARFNRERMKEATERGFLEATDIAEYLVMKGLPFRRAHHVVGSIVSYCLEKGKTFKDLSLKEWRSFSPLFEEDVLSVVDVEGALDRRKVEGGGGREDIRRRIERLKEELGP